MCIKKGAFSSIKKFCILKKKDTEALKKNIAM